MIPLIVKPKVLASAYGLSSVMMNIGLAVGPVMVGALTFQSKGVDAYFYVIISLGSFCIFSILTSLLLLLFNRMYLKGILQKSSTQIEKENAMNVKLDEEELQTSSVSSK